jgi:predicted dehydrogenase
MPDVAEWVPPLRVGMVGGGPEAFIGAVHRQAMRLDDSARIVCGAFSSTAERSRAQGAALGLDPGRVHGAWHDLIAAEAARPARERMEALVIVTPNDLHLPVAAAALAAGFAVFSDKPATRTLAEARELVAAVRSSGRPYALAHTYLGYPAVREARVRVAAGALGRVRRVVVDYPQGWLSSALEAGGHKQAAWRTDPARSGPGGVIADIGTHAFNLAEYVTGTRVAAVCADLASVVPGRRVDDDAAVFLRFADGARGVLLASQVATGEDNDLSIRVYGERGAIAWNHGAPDRLVVLDAAGASRREIRVGAGAAELDPEVRRYCRTPPGHPEGFIEALANLYRDFAGDVRAPGTMARSAAGPAAALRGMAFVEATIASSAAGQAWQQLPENDE